MGQMDLPYKANQKGWWCQMQFDPFRGSSSYRCIVQCFKFWVLCYGYLIYQLIYLFSLWVNATSSFQSINQFINFSDKWRKWIVWNAGEQFLEFLKCSWICEWSWRSSPRASSARRWMSGRCPCETFLARNRKREITEITEITALLLSFCSYFVISSNCSVFLCPLLKSLFRASIGFQASPRQPAQDPAVSPPDFGQIALHVRH